MDTVQWPQEIGLVKPMEELVPSTTTSTTTTRPHLMERRARPQKEQALNCPRCNSTNTKFCYYNNYSLTQPRYFCKTCRRYWTEGGSLRNVPVGGGSRKNKRSTSSSSVAAAANPNSTAAASSSTVTAASSTVSTSRKLPPELSPTPISLSTSSQNPKFHEGQDLNLGFPHHNLPEFNGFPNLENNNSSNNNNNSSSSHSGSNPCTAVGALSAMELLRSGMGARGLGHFMPMPMPEYPAGFGVGLQEFRPPTLGFPLDGIGGEGGGNGGGGGYRGLHGVQESASGRLLFPFEELKPVPSSTAAEFDPNRGQVGDPPGFWNGMMGGGGSW